MTTAGAERVYFYGTFEHAMDERGRVAVPALYRRAFETGGVLRPAAEGCVELYTHEAFEAETQRRLSGPEESTRTRAARRTRRGFLAEAFPVELDRQGRILVPSSVRTSTGLDSRAVIVGCGDYLELWDQARWAEEKAALAAEEAEL
jgi:MraZ protein